MKSVALLGCGRIGMAWAQAFDNVAVSRIGQLRYVVDEDLSRANAMASATGAVPLTDFGQLDGQMVSAAIVCTPPATHAALVRHALAEGMDVLCEKPLTASSTDGWSLFQLARDKNKRLTVSEKYCNSPDVLAATEFLRSGSAGSLRTVDCKFHSKEDFSGTWRMAPVAEGGGVLMDNGPHVFDLLQQFGVTELGDFVVEDVHWVRGNATVPSAIKFRATTSGDQNVGISLSWLESCPNEPYVRLGTNMGVLALQWGATVWIPKGGEPQQLSAGYQKAQAFARQLDKFLAHDACSEQSAIAAQLWSRKRTWLERACSAVSAVSPSRIA